MQENTAQQQDAVFYLPIYYWQFNYDAQAQTGFFSPEPFRVLLSNIIFPQCLRHTVRQTVECMKFQKLLLCFP